MRVAYFARPMYAYGNKQDVRNVNMIRQMGYEPIDFTTEKFQDDAKIHGMTLFKPLVESSEVLFFQPFINGKIPAGVAKEIAWAQEADIPVLEIPLLYESRILTVEETRYYLSFHGQR